mmetsp:Transcript_7914/g.14267  ORF Transcript_7914/g.14267 Transcript_7914/m.14267 type:complete len:756 (-) Transcript_7914:69-2336(-)
MMMNDSTDESDSPMLVAAQPLGPERVNGTHNVKDNSMEPSSVFVKEQLSCSISILMEIVGAFHLTLSHTKAKQGSSHNIDETDANGWNAANGNSLSEEDDNDDSKKDVNMNPFCVVARAGQILHQTDPVHQDGNPIWTASTKSLLILTTSAKELYDNKNKNPLKFNIWCHPNSSWDGIPRPVGHVHLDISTILLHYCDEQRHEFPLSRTSPTKKNGMYGPPQNVGVLALRFRFATDADIQFVQGLYGGANGHGCTTGSSSAATSPHSSSLNLANFWTSAVFRNLNDDLACGTNQEDMEQTPEMEKKTSSRLLITEMDETELAGVGVFNGLSTFFELREFVDKDTGIYMKKPKPCVDPERPELTKYMSEEQIYTETFGPSQNWTEAGSGNLGKVYLEVLRCEDLPNVDVGEAVGNVTDAFVCAVYEDVLVQTPVIDDELSPYFLPWTQRAFCFHMMHPASMLYLGVFDYDLGPLDHEAIGRVAVNISNLKRDTIYTLQYKLYNSSSVTERKDNGKITIRIRIEIPDERAALMAGLKPRPRMHVNVRKPKTLGVLRYTCFGEYGEEEHFDLTVLRSYINEILEYKQLLSYSVGDSLRSLIFWRGQVSCGSCYIPLHSAIFFWGAATLVEKPYLFPPAFFLGIAWIMLAIMGSRMQHPSPWKTCISFLYFLNTLWYGQSTHVQTNIDPNQNQEEDTAYEEAWSNRLANDQKKAEKQWALQQRIDKIGDDNIQTKKGSSGLELELVTKLGRWQNIVGRK